MLTGVVFNYADARFHYVYFRKVFQKWVL